MFHEIDETCESSLTSGNELETRIILGRWRSLAGGFAAHGALVAFWTVRTIVWSVFGARRSPFVLLDRLARFQSMNRTSIVACVNVTACCV